MRKQSFRLLCMLLALVMTFSMVLTGAPMHVHAAEDIVVTVGASGCDYTTINAALDAIAGMSRSSGQRAVIEIQPGNYEEMLYIELDNITLRNASSNPSIALTNKGVDIDANAVRITHYYGHGYNYYSMDSNYRYSDSVLASNKSKGSASTTNPGAGSSTHWNATVVIAGNNFIAEDIIFENSFNQYISQKSKNDTIVKTSGAKEGSTPRVNLPVGSTAVQDKTYVERAAALAIKNKAQNAFFDHCKFVGRQDTLYGGRPVTAAFYDCEIYGACDYIFGGMTAVFAKCDLVFNTSDHKDDKGYITASQTQSGSRGMLFYNCHITSTTPGVDTASAYASKPGYLGRPWAENTGEAIFYYTVIDATCSNWSSQSKSLIQPVGWLDTLGGESKLSGEYGTVELSGVNNSSSRESWATGVNSSGKLLDGSTISVSTFLGSWNPFSGKDMTIVTDGTVIEPEQPTTTTSPSTTTAPSATTAPSGGDVVVPAGSYVHNFTENGKTSDFYSITGNTSTSKGSVSYNGLTLTTCLKMESSTNISFTDPAAGTLTLVFGGSTAAGGKRVTIDGTTYTADSNGIVTADIASGSHTVIKGDSINLFYMVYTPEGSSGSEGGGTEETVTATGALNMSSVTVTKAAGAADPTTVNASLLSGLTMTVNYSDGTSASIALSDLVISNIKSHDTLGKYIDVDYNDPVTGTKVHCYILVTIQEESGSEGGGESGGTTTTSTYSFDAARDVAVGLDKDAIAAGTTYTDGYFTVTGTVTQRVSSGAVYTVEVGKNATGALQFTVTGTATVEVQFSSTGNTNTSAIGLHDASGNLVANNEGITEVTGASSGKTVVTYTLSAGTYSVVSPSSSYSRGARVYYINVTETLTGGESHTHSYTEEITTAATCTTAGVKTFTCSCGEGTYTEAIPALGHTAGAAATCTTAQTCTVCNATITAALGHTEVTDAAVTATCTTAGKTEGKHCSACGTVTVAQTTVAALGHTNAAAVKESEKPATCGSDGSYESVVYCSVCNAEVSRDTITVPATGAHVYATESQRVAATCTADGYVIMACGCGATQTTILTATGHTEVTDAAVSATCTTTGKTEGKHCSVCGTVTVAQTTVAALGHTNAAAVKESEKPATCGADGSYESVVYCSVCKAEVSRNTITVPATGAHVYATESQRVAATCTADGYVIMACGCGATQTTTLTATGHTEVTDAAVTATCTTAGKTEGKHCSVCGTVTVAQTTVAALGHTNAAAVKESEKPATCGSDGSYESVVYCSVCKAEVSRDTVTVPSTGDHVYATESQRVAATCTADGYVIMACGCGATQTTILTATGHTEVTDAAVTATCTETGKTEGKHCSVCGTVTVAQTTVAALGHKEKVIVGEAATCTETGLTDGKICERCGETLEAQKEIPALGHTNAAAVTENEKAATCTVDGSYDSVVYCSVCKAEVSREKVTIKADGHDAVIDKAVDASCTAPGKTEGKHCGTCGEILTAQTEVEALGHDYKDGICTRCGAADPEYVPTFTVSGGFVSHGKTADAVAIEFFIEGQTEAAYSFVSDGAANSGDWSIAGIVSGSYTVKVSKANHVSREYELTVGEENVTDMNVEIWLLGDADGDGLVNVLDYGNVLRQVKYPEQPILTDYNRQCADANGDGEITFWDYLLILWHMKGSRLLW